MKTEAVTIVGVTHGRRCFQQPRGRRCLVGVNFAVALVAGDHKVVLVGQRNELLQSLARHDRTGGVAGGANEEQLAGLPLIRAHRREIGKKGRVCPAINQERLGAC